MKRAVDQSPINRLVMQQRLKTGDLTSRDHQKRTEGQHERLFCRSATRPACLCVSTRQRETLEGFHEAYFVTATCNCCRLHRR